LHITERGRTFTELKYGKMENLKSKSNKIRPNLLDDIITHSDKNLYCGLSDLSNEASVETFFMTPLLFDLGYTNRNIKTKESIRG